MIEMKLIYENDDYYAMKHDGMYFLFTKKIIKTILKNIGESKTKTRIGIYDNNGTLHNVYLKSVYGRQAIIEIINKKL
jgi:hypothetical protein